MKQTNARCMREKGGLEIAEVARAYLPQCGQGAIAGWVASELFSQPQISAITPSSSGSERGQAHLILTRQRDNDLMGLLTKSFNTTAESTV